MVKFNLKLNIVGLNCDKYNFITMGDKNAKIVNIVKDKIGTTIVIDSIYTRGEVDFMIESIWEIKRKQKTFKIVEVILNISKFDLNNDIYMIPKSHRAALKRWYKTC